MTTVSYAWDTAFPAFSFFGLNNIQSTGAQIDPAIASSFDHSRTFNAWASPGFSLNGIHGRVINSDGTPVGDEFIVNLHPGTMQIASVAALADGRFVATYTYTGNNIAPPGIFTRIFNADGSSAADDVRISGGSGSDVAGLADGGYVVASRGVAQVFNADGSTRATGGQNGNLVSSVAALSADGPTGGGFVVASALTLPNGDSAVYFRRFNANGVALDASNVLIDDFGNINKGIQIAGLPDGGFVVAYTDNGWMAGTDITAQVFNADGSIRSQPLRVNLANGGGVVGDQNLPTRPCCRMASSPSAGATETTSFFALTTRMATRSPIRTRLLTAGPSRARSRDCRAALLRWLWK